MKALDEYFLEEVVVTLLLNRLRVFAILKQSVRIEIFSIGSKVLIWANSLKNSIVH